MKNRKLYYVALLPLLIGIILGSFYDFQINNFLFKPDNNLLKGLYAFTPCFGYAFFSIICGFVHRFAIREKTPWLKVLLIIIFISGMVATVNLSAGHVTSINGFNIPEKKWAWLIIFALFQSIFFYFGDKFGKTNDNKSILWASLILVVFMVIELVPLAQILKVIMRRPRFRVAISGTYEATFVPWWQPFTRYKELKDIYGPTAPSFSEQFKSFPSGHASAAAVLIFGLPFLSNLSDKFKGKETILFIIGYVYTLFVGFARMLVGAHYLTDVCFAALLMVVCSIFANEINLKFFNIPSSDVK